MDISVIIPLYNEEESLPELYAWIERVMKENNFSYEVVFVNDGSTDHSWDVIEELRKKSNNVKGIKFRRNYGKSPALYCGFETAEGDVVITMDADLQDSPDEIPGLYKMIKEEGYDLVSGYKQKRYDPLSKTIPTKLFNATARKISGIHNLHDFNCGLKAYRKEVVKNIEVYGEMHRYIPYLAKNAGFDKIGEKVVHHQARKYGKSKFGLNRFFNGYLDLLTLWFLSNFNIHGLCDVNDSILASIGTFIAPIFKPLGFGNWQSSVSLLTGLLAKESVVASMSVIFSGDLYAVLPLHFTALSAFSFMVFVLLYTPCISVIGTMKKEFGNKMCAFSVIYQVLLAWIASFAVYNIGSLIIYNKSYIEIFITALLLISAIFILYKSSKNNSCKNCKGSCDSCNIKLEK